MTIPQVEGNISPEPILPTNAPAREVQSQLPPGTRAANFIATSLFSVPKEGGAALLFQGKELFQHQVVKILISKFDPNLAQMAVISYRAQAQTSPIEKQQPDLPKETGKQRDEVSGDTTLGKNVTKLEVQQGESGQAGGERQAFQKETKAPEKTDNSQPVEKEGPLAIPTKLPPEKSPPSDEKTPAKEIPAGQKEVKESKSEPNKPEGPKAARTEAREQFPLQSEKVTKQESSPLMTSRDNLQPKKENVEGKFTRKEDSGLVDRLDDEQRDKLAESKFRESIEHKFIHHPKDPASLIGAAHQGRMRSEDVVPPIFYRVHPIEIDATGLIPPWLLLAIPELMNVDEARGRKSGKNKGKQLENPYKLSDILFILIAAHLTGSKTLEEIFQWMQQEEKWLTIVLGLRFGLPPRQLFFWFLASLNQQEFNEAVLPWLAEVRGLSKERLLPDVQLWKTPLGFVIGQKPQPGDFPQAQMLGIVRGFDWSQGTVMIKAEEKSPRILSQVAKAGGQYIAYVDEEIEVSEEHDSYESYIEGQERHVLQIWKAENDTWMKLFSELYGKNGVATSEAVYVSNIEDPVEEFFTLFRLQRPYENQNRWLLNVGLDFSTIDEALLSALSSLKKFQEASIQILGEVPGFSLEQKMVRASKDHGFLLSLFRHER